MCCRVVRGLRDMSRLSKQGGRGRSELTRFVLSVLKTVFVLDDGRCEFERDW